MPEIHVKESIAIIRKVGDIYRFWRNLEDLPLFIDHLESVEDLGEGHNRWTIKTPVGHISWESEIIEDKENEIIRWRSMLDSRVKNSGSLVLKKRREAMPPRLLWNSAIIPRVCMTRSWRRKFLRSRSTCS
jgi:uncharacterized membrane protein